MKSEEGGSIDGSFKLALVQFHTAIVSNLSLKLQVCWSDHTSPKVVGGAEWEGRSLSVGLTTPLQRLWWDGHSLSVGVTTPLQR